MQSGVVRNSLMNNVVQSSIVPCSSVQCRAVQCTAVPCSAIQCNSVPYSTIQCNSVQFSATGIFSSTTVFLCLFVHISVHSFNHLFVVPLNHLFGLISPNCGCYERQKGFSHWVYYLDIIWIFPMKYLDSLLNAKTPLIFLIQNIEINHARMKKILDVCADLGSDSK